MNEFFKKYLKYQIAGSIILVGLVFSVGFYMGSSSSKYTVTAPSSQSITSSSSPETVDLSSFWKVWGILDERFAPASSTVAKNTSKNKIYGAIAGLTASYGDPYTTFFPPVESKMFSDEISGSFDGVGMEIAVQDGTLTVVAPVKGSPAERAGVQAGDKIVRIGNTSAETMPTDQAVKLIRGEKGTKIDVTFVRKGSKDPLTKTLTREPIDIPTVQTKKLDNGIFLISLYNFSAVSPNLFRGALREFVQSGSDKLILDLRNNPGGYLEAALDMASWFLPTGKVVVTEKYADGTKPDIYKSKGYDVFTDDLKFVILVNAGSASASEILAGALSEYGKATLIGENTFGKGSVQELLPVTADTSLKVTVAHWFTPNDRSISNGGLKPKIEVKQTEKDTKLQVDTVLQRAVEFLSTDK